MSPVHAVNLVANSDNTAYGVEYSRNPLQGCQVLLNFSILLLKLHFCYWHFHEILAKILKFVLISQWFLHKNTEICVKLCKNTEIVAICYWSDFPEVGSPAFITRSISVEVLIKDTP